MHYYVKSISLSVEQRGVVLGGCALWWQFLWVVWGEQNKKTFENVVGVEVEFLWQKGALLGFFVGICSFGSLRDLFFCYLFKLESLCFVIVFYAFSKKKKKCVLCFFSEVNYLFTNFVLFLSLIKFISYKNQMIYINRQTITLNYIYTYTNKKQYFFPWNRCSLQHSNQKRSPKTKHPECWLTYAQTEAHC